MAQEQLELREASGNEKPVFGISEWMCYYANYDKPCPGPKALDECVDLHLQAGCDPSGLESGAFGGGLLVRVAP